MRAALTITNSSARTLAVLVALAIRFIPPIAIDAADQGDTIYAAGDVFRVGVVGGRVLQERHAASRERERPAISITARHVLADGGRDDSQRGDRRDRSAATTGRCWRRRLRRAIRCAPGRAATRASSSSGAGATNGSRPSSSTSAITPSMPTCGSPTDRVRSIGASRAGPGMMRRRGVPRGRRRHSHCIDTPPTIWRPRPSASRRSHRSHGHVSPRSHEDRSP